MKNSDRCPERRRKERGRKSLEGARSEWERVREGERQGERSLGGAARAHGVRGREWAWKRGREKEVLAEQ